MKKYFGKYRIPSARLQNWDYRRHAAYFITICTHNRKHYFGKIVQFSKNSSPQMQLSPVGVIADILWYEIKNHTTNMELDAFIVMPNHIHGILILTGTESTVKTLHATSLPTSLPTSQPDNTPLPHTTPLSTPLPDTTPLPHTTPPIMTATTVKTLHATSLPQHTDTMLLTGQTLHATSLPTSLPDTTPLPHATSLPTSQPLHTAPLQSPPETPNPFMSLISPKPLSVSAIIRSYKSAVTKHAHRLGFDFEWQSRFYDHVIRDEKSYHNIRNYIIRNPANWPGDKFYIK